jgi:catechol 2,3-dioxygenase-like lactoylglutathione lyase family enzyme
MIDHLSIGVKAIGQSRIFYDRVLEPLGYARLADLDQASGYGAGHDFFWIAQAAGEKTVAGSGTHIAFTAPTRRAVNEFHARALQLGGIDQGLPGPRPPYGDNYYAAFVLDPDGHKIEAVIRLPETDL